MYIDHSFLEENIGSKITLPNMIVKIEFTHICIDFGIFWPQLQCFNFLLNIKGIT